MLEAFQIVFGPAFWQHDILVGMGEELRTAAARGSTCPHPSWLAKLREQLPAAATAPLHQVHRVFLLYILYGFVFFMNLNIFLWFIESYFLAGMGGGSRSKSGLCLKISLLQRQNFAVYVKAWNWRLLNYHKCFDFNHPKVINIS